MRHSNRNGNRIPAKAIPAACGLVLLLAGGQASGQPAPGPPSPTPAAHHQPPPVILFVSPIPPALGAASTPGGRMFSTGPAAPAAMAAYVNEPFYALLATRLFRNNLGSRSEERRVG